MICGVDVNVRVATSEHAQQIRKACRRDALAWSSENIRRSDRGRNSPSARRTGGFGGTITEKDYDVSDHPRLSKVNVGRSHVTG